MPPHNSAESIKVYALPPVISNTIDTNMMDMVVLKDGVMSEGQTPNASAIEMMNVIISVEIVVAYFVYFLHTIFGPPVLTAVNLISLKDVIAA